MEPLPQSSSHNCFIKDGVVCSTVRSVLYAVRFYTHQRWSHRGHGLSLEDPRGQLTMTLVLGFKFSFLALGCQSLSLASDYQSLALALGYQSLALPLASDCQSLPWPQTISPWPWKLFLTLALSIRIFWQSTHYHPLPFSQVSRST